MSNLYFIGDIHGHWSAYRRLINHHEPTIQVGDMGFGFPGWQKTDPQKFKGEHFFIRGNHDNPEVCRNHPNYLGDFGFDEKFGIFYISGAHSIDWQSRVEGMSWWRNEELDYASLQQCVDLYKQVKPTVVVSHDCPKSIQSLVMSYHTETQRTNSVLQFMFEQHQPAVWVFGHHHKFFREQVNGTIFQCVATERIMSLEHIKDPDSHEV